MATVFNLANANPNFTYILAHSNSKPRWIEHGPKWTYCLLHHVHRTVFIAINDVIKKLQSKKKNLETTCFCSNKVLKYCAMPTCSRLISIKAEQMIGQIWIQWTEDGWKWSSAMRFYWILWNNEHNCSFGVIFAIHRFINENSSIEMNHIALHCEHDVMYSNLLALFILVSIYKAVCPWWINAIQQ